MSSELRGILGDIEKLETNFDEYQQAIQKSKENIIQNLSQTWKKLKKEQEEIVKLEMNIETQNSELTELNMKASDLDRKTVELNSSKEENQLKVSELNSNLEKISDDLKSPSIELGNLQSKLASINEKIVIKESEKLGLEQKKIDNENREKQLNSLYTEDKMEELNRKLVQLKRNNYFTSFIIENSVEDIPEVDIISTIMNQGSCNLDELKKLLDIPPIMSVRTIKQLAIKGIINLDESTNIITMP
jgi:chromosome segregation ATPase